MMPKQYLVWICSILIVITTSCEKYNQIDNTGIVRTPYVLYVGGLAGSMHKTNDANYFLPLFPIDNTPVRQVITADSNLLYLKGNCYVSDDEGRAFNVCNTNARPYYNAFYKYFLPHQMLYDKSEKLVYLCTNGGLSQSADFGKTFTNAIVGGAPTSIVELDNDDVYAIQDDANIYKRTGGVGPWTQVPVGTSTLAAGTNYYLTSHGNTLVATDYEGTLGCYYSTNGGVDWTRYGGVAGNGRFILFVNSVANPAGGNDLFLGRDSMGLFKLDPASQAFEATSSGIPWYAKLQYVEGKKLVFRTGVERFYYFCATDVGLFLSEQDSGGEDWRPIRNGAFSTLQ